MWEVATPNHGYMYIYGYMMLNVWGWPPFDDLLYQTPHMNPYDLRVTLHLWCYWFPKSISWADHFRSPSGKMCCYCLCARWAERMLRAPTMDGVFFPNGWWGLCCWSRVAEILSPRWALYLGRLKTEMARVVEMFGLCGILRSHMSPYDHLHCELSSLCGVGRQQLIGIGKNSVIVWISVGTCRGIKRTLVGPRAGGFLWRTCRQPVQQTCHDQLFAAPYSA